MYININSCQSVRSTIMPQKRGRMRKRNRE